MGKKVWQKKNLASTGNRNNTKSNPRRTLVVKQGKLVVVVKP